jgi:hypothetical protein
MCHNATPPHFWYRFAGGESAHDTRMVQKMTLVWADYDNTEYIDVCILIFLTSMHGDVRLEPQVEHTTNKRYSRQLDLYTWRSGGRLVV